MPTGPGSRLTLSCSHPSRRWLAILFTYDLSVNPPRRGGRAVYCGGLENRRPTRSQGSNPCLSATILSVKCPFLWSRTSLFCAQSVAIAGSNGAQGRTTPNRTRRSSRPVRCSSRQPVDGRVGEEPLTRSELQTVNQNAGSPSRPFFRRALVKQPFCPRPRGTERRD